MAAILIYIYVHTHIYVSVCVCVRVSNAPPTFCYASESQSKIIHLRPFGPFRECWISHKNKNRIETVQHLLEILKIAMRPYVRRPLVPMAQFKKIHSVCKFCSESIISRYRILLIVLGVVFRRRGTSRDDGFLLVLAGARHLGDSE